MDERETRLSINSISMYNMNGLNFLIIYYAIGYQKDLLCVDLPPPPLNAAKINALLDNAKTILQQKAAEYKASRSGPEYVDDGVEPVPNMATLPASFVDPGAAAKEAAAKALAEAMAAFEAARAELDEALENEALLLKRHQRLSTTPGGAADAAEDAYKAGKKAREAAEKALLAATEKADSLTPAAAPAPATTKAPNAVTAAPAPATTKAPNAVTAAPSATTKAPNAVTAAPSATTEAESRAKVTLLDRNLPAHKEYFGSIITEVYGSTLWKKDVELVDRARECLDEQNGRLIMMIGQEWNFQDIRSVVMCEIIRGDLK